MPGIIILSAILVIVVLYFAAKEFQHIAELKGYNDEKYFWWSFLTVFGSLMVIALPAKTEVVNSVQSVSQEDEIPDI